MASDCKKVMKKHSYPDFLRWFRSFPGQFDPFRAQFKLIKIIPEKSI